MKSPKGEVGGGERGEEKNVRALGYLELGGFFAVA